MDEYDLIVIGSGPAGEKGAVQAAYYEKRVALVEQPPFLGGAGINTGAVPSNIHAYESLQVCGPSSARVFAKHPERPERPEGCEWADPAEGPTGGLLNASLHLGSARVLDAHPDWLRCESLAEQSDPRDPRT